MAISDTETLIHLPFADRPQYASPYPEGIAVGHHAITGDATGGAVAAALQADGGFLYRLELLTATTSTITANLANFLTAHRWASDRAGVGTSAFSLNWSATQIVPGSFSVFEPTIEALKMIRRFAMGRTDRVELQVLASFNWATNVDTTVYDIVWAFTYWPTTALYRPGFLASFYESPFVPTFA